MQGKKLSSFLFLHPVANSKGFEMVCSSFQYGGHNLVHQGCSVHATGIDGKSMTQCEVLAEGEFKLFGLCGQRGDSPN